MQNINLVLAFLLSFVLSYLLGSISTSILVSRLFGKGDIREHGSGNAGATNTLRVVGGKAAILVVIGDALKAVVSIYLSKILCGLMFSQSANYTAYIASVGAVIGHVYPIYFGFKGGKGIMTSIAAVLCLDWRIGLILIAVFAVVVLIFNYVSLASCVSSFVYPFLVGFIHKGEFVFLSSAIIMALIAILKHSSNIKRLIAGTESKLIKR